MTAPTWFTLARGARAADALIAKLAPELVSKAPDPTTREGFDKEVRNISLRLLTAARKQEGAAAKALINALDVNWPKLSARDREQVIRQGEALIGRLGSAVAPPLRAVLREEGKRLVTVARGATVGRFELPIAATFGRQDERIVEHAAKSQALFVTDNYKKRGVSLSQQARDIVAKGLDDGLDRYDIGADIRLAIGTQLGRSDSYYPLIASIFTARARTWSVLSSFEEAGIPSMRFSAVIDEATCFAAGTRILLGDGQGTAPIEQLGIGDVVMSCCGRPRRIVATSRQPSRHWGELMLNSPSAGPLVFTRPHGFLTNKGWMRARFLKRDDGIATWVASGPRASSTLWSDERSWGMRRGRIDQRTLEIAPWPHPMLDRLGTFAAIVSLIWTFTGRTEDAHDIEVEEDAGYVAEGVLVHNSNICRFLDGRVFSVGSAAQRYRDVAENEDPEAVKSLQPFVKERDGYLYVGPSEGEGHFRIAHVDESAVGRRDERGTFSHGAEVAQLEKAGVTAPPLHGHCRSDLVPEGASGSSVSVPAQIRAPKEPKAPKVPATLFDRAKQKLDEADQNLRDMGLPLDRVTVPEQLWKDLLARRQAAQADIGPYLPAGIGGLTSADVDRLTTRHLATLAKELEGRAVSSDGSPWMPSEAKKLVDPALRDRVQTVLDAYYSRSIAYRDTMAVAPVDVRLAARRSSIEAMLANTDKIRDAKQRAAVVEAIVQATQAHSEHALEVMRVEGTKMVHDPGNSRASARHGYLTSAGSTHQDLTDLVAKSADGTYRTDYGRATETVSHELGHVFDQIACGRGLTGAPWVDRPDFDNLEKTWKTGINGVFERQRKDKIIELPHESSGTNRHMWDGNWIDAYEARIYNGTASKPVPKHMSAYKGLGGPVEFIAMAHQYVQEGLEGVARWERSFGSLDKAREKLGTFTRGYVGAIQSAGSLERSRKLYGTVYRDSLEHLTGAGERLVKDLVESKRITAAAFESPRDVLGFALAVRYHHGTPLEQLIGKKGILTPFLGDTAFDLPRLKKWSAVLDKVQHYDAREWLKNVAEAKAEGAFDLLSSALADPVP